MILYQIGHIGFRLASIAPQYAQLVGAVDLSPRRPLHPDTSR